MGVLSGKVTAAQATQGGYSYCWSPFWYLHVSLISVQNPVQIVRREPRMRRVGKNVRNDYEGIINRPESNDWPREGTK